MEKIKYGNITLHPELGFGYNLKKLLGQDTSPGEFMSFIHYYTQASPCRKFTKVDNNGDILLEVWAMEEMDMIFLDNCVSKLPGGRRSSELEITFGPTMNHRFLEPEGEYSPQWSLYRGMGIKLFATTAPVDYTKEIVYEETK